MSGNESGPVKKDDGFSDLEARLSGSCGRTNSGRCLIEGPSYYNNNDSSAQASSSGVSLRRLFSLSSVSASCPRLDEELENEIVSQAGDIGIRSSRQGENYFHFAKEQGGLGFQTPQELLLNSNTISPAVSPLVSDIITPPLTTSLLHKEQQEEMIKELPPCFEYIAYLIHLAVFGIIGAYAAAVGFVVRKSTVKRRKNGIVSFQVFLCNKHGYKEKRKIVEDDISEEEDGCDEVNTHVVKRKVCSRVGCNAQMILKYKEEGCYLVTKFKEGHNHPMYSAKHSHLKKHNRNLTVFHKKLILDNSKVNIGPVTTYRMLSRYAGGYENVGATVIDFKNFHRDLKGYIEGSDAQMFVDNFQRKKLISSAYFFDYEMDEDGCLCRALWVDPIGRRNYAVFGDMISFDTTYQTNRYNMVFGPFTGVDHHKKCVTFGAGFIAKEDVGSFEWLFKTFLKAMGGDEPNCLITDQDPAMKIAVNNVFQKSEHRFCMWHIMKKFPEKVGRITIEDNNFPGEGKLIAIQDTDFLKNLSKCVWNSEIEPAEFEQMWNNVLVKYKLQNHDWLNLMFEMRSMWIPAYFRDVFMGGILRTTSRSESENKFFTSFLNPHVSLVEFFMRYESALDAQRHSLTQCENDTQDKYPERKTELLIEKHGSEVYTISVFYDFQDEVYNAFYCCGVDELRNEGDVYVAILNEVDRNRKFKVLFHCISYETTCSCKKFYRIGVPCKHMVWMWNAKNLKKIPKQYILDRWTKSAIEKPILGRKCSDNGDGRKMAISEMWSEIFSCVSVIQGREEEFTKYIREFKSRCHSAEIVDHARSNEEDIEMLLGCSLPEQIYVQPPKVSKNKGTGVHESGSKRLKSNKEKAIEESNKRTRRKCRSCGELGYHDSRNCPKKEN